MKRAALLALAVGLLVGRGERSSHARAGARPLELRLGPGAAHCPTHEAMRAAIFGPAAGLPPEEGAGVTVACEIAATRNGLRAEIEIVAHATGTRAVRTLEVPGRRCDELARAVVLAVKLARAGARPEVDAAAGHEGTTSGAGMARAGGAPTVLAPLPLPPAGARPAAGPPVPASPPMRTAGAGRRPASQPAPPARPDRRARLERAAAPAAPRRLAAAPASPAEAAIGAKPAPLAASQSPGQAPGRRGWEVAVGGGFSWRELPGAMRSLALGVDARTPRSSIGGELALGAPGRLWAARERIHLWQAKAALVPCLRTGPLSGCAPTGVGLLSGAGRASDGAPTDRALVAGTGLRLGWDVGLSSGFALRVHGDLQAFFARARLRIGGEVRWAMPAVAAGLGVRVVHRFF